MFWMVLFVIIFIVMLALVVWLYLRDRKYMRSKTFQVMSEALKMEIEDEREKAMKRKEKFKEILKSTSKREKFFDE